MIVDICFLSRQFLLTHLQQKSVSILCCFFLEKLDDSNMDIVIHVNDLEKRNTTTLTPLHLPPPNVRSVTIGSYPLVLGDGRKLSETEWSHFLESDT